MRNFRLHYFAYQSRRDGTDFTWDGRDMDKGILGTFVRHDDCPIAVADSLEDIRHEARAHLGKEPDRSLYLVDSEQHVYEIVINEKFHAVTDRANDRTAITAATLVFCFTCLLATYGGSLGTLPLLGFFGATAMYVVILRLKLFNLLEGAVVCETFLFLYLLAAPTILSAH